jgi:hypothetical protein
VTTIEQDLRLAWLAGLWDGEGSIGITRNGTAGLCMAVQMSMTCEMTIRTAMDVMQDLGIRGLGYTYQEKKVERHRDACYMRVNRMDDIQKLAREMIKYAITKEEHWQLVLEFVNSRLEGTMLDEQGRIVRGGVIDGKLNLKWWKPYSERELAIKEKLSILNTRGPKGQNRRITTQYGAIGREQKGEEAC